LETGGGTNGNANQGGIRGDRPALRAFFAVLNRAFADFRLNLKPGDLANVETVQDHVDVIADWFSRHGYQVVS
jgi:hypothetical protein